MKKILKIRILDLWYLLRTCRWYCNTGGYSSSRRIPNGVLPCQWYVAFLQAESIFDVCWLYISINPLQPDGTRAPSKSPLVSWWPERRTGSSVIMIRLLLY